MANSKKWLPLFLLPLLLSGCALNTIVNLTPSRLPRKETGQYLVEAEFKTRQESLVKDSIKGYVVVGMEQYPMQRVPMLTNRWETLVPVPADKDVLTFRYRFDYEYRAIPARRPDNVQSKHYQVFILQR
jgi:hypothetical protein